VSLSWQAPGSNGGAAITGYRVYQGTSKQPVASVTGTGTTVKNLTNGTGYSFKVTAVNKVGEGPPRVRHPPRRRPRSRNPDYRTG
jgi:hypothetical protein